MYRLFKVNLKNKRLKIFVKILSIFVYLITIPIIVFNMTLIIKSYLNPGKIPSFFGYKNFTIVSRSMEDTINVNDVIVVKEVPKSEIKKNDIIAFYQGREVITHRVIDIIDENGIICYRTKGDNNIHPDDKLVSYSQVEGKYQFKIAGFGIVLRVLKSPVTIIMLIIILILNCIYGYNYRRKKEMRTKKRAEYDRKNKKKEE